MIDRAHQKSSLPSSQPCPHEYFLPFPPSPPTSFPKWSFPYRLLHRLITLPGLHSLNITSSFLVHSPRASQVVLVVKNPRANAGDVREPGSIPALGRSPGGGHGNPLQYSCLENPMDRGAWQAVAHRVA